MADTVDTLTLLDNGIHHHIRITNESDGTGESAVVKIDMSGITAFGNEVIKAVDVDRIFGMVGGFNYVVLEWDASTNDEIVVLAPGTFDFDFRDQGGLRNPLSASATGDIQLTTDGAIDGAAYTITIEGRIRNE